MVTGNIVLFGRYFRLVPRPVMTIAVVAGILDITGSVARSARLKLDGWMRRSCSAHFILQLPFCLPAFFCASTSAVSERSAWSPRWWRCP